ncbi:proton-conducting transporter membrane subunit, partial [Kytococcus schroeteri]|uniref:proton-conducting transporter transmembrane domain-containing protein n=1 Tax=Kytococcus schroeteri TaxID=138300 RepID=UPI0022AACCCB
MVDHQAGSRDIRRLGPLWRQMPFTFVSAVIAAASMAAVPPTFGFVSKEGMLTAFEEAPFNNAGVIALLVAAGLGALATFVYSARYVFGAFIDGPKDMSHVKEAPANLWIPAVLPGVLSLPGVAFLGLFDETLDQVVDATGLGHAHTHLALWHGLTVALWISLAVLVAGVIVVIYRRPLLQPLEGKRLGVATG